MVIMQHATGDLRLIINELDIATLTDEQGDEKVAAHVKDAFQEYLENNYQKQLSERFSLQNAVDPSKNRCFSTLLGKRFFFRN